MWVPDGVLQYRCEDGFSFDGLSYAGQVRDIECLANGHYTEMRACLEVDDCVGHSCGAFGTCLDLHMDYTCECVEGFEMHVDEGGEKLCGNIDDCDGHQCGEGGICVDLIQEHECECHEGWELGSPDGFPICQRKECGLAPQVDNVLPTADEPGIFPWTRGKAVFEEVVEYDCAYGYSTDGQLGGPRTFSITCQADTNYTEVQECLPISCGEPDTVGEATPSVSAPVLFGQTVDYSCPSGYGPETFTRTCLEDGQFSPAIACEPRPDVPVVCEKPAAPLNWEWVNDAVLTSQTSAFLRCADGYQSSQGDAEQRFEITCDSDGVSSPLPDACEVASYTVSGHIKNAVDLHTLTDVTLMIADQPITLDGNNRYTISLPEGSYGYTLSAEGHISILEGSMTVSRTNQHDHHLFMYPVREAGTWGIVLEWGQHPTDLDSHLIFHGESPDSWLWPCPSQMYYGHPHAECSNSYTGGDPKVTANLDVDDTTSYGPETTTLSNTDTCPSFRTCKWIYKVKNYAGSAWSDTVHGWDDSQAVVTLYNNEAVHSTFRVADQRSGAEGHGFTASDGVGGDWTKSEADFYWSVFSIDVEGNIEPCTSAACD